MNKRYSLHHIHSADEFTFSPEEYSYFKYGDKSYAEKFAKELFEGFISEHEDILNTDKEIVVLPSPYMAIPTASNFYVFTLRSIWIFICFRKEKIKHFIENQQKSYLYHRLWKFNFEDRKNLIANDTYYIDKDFLEENFVFL
jgi:hypothetical protein